MRDTSKQILIVNHQPLFSRAFGEAFVKKFPDVVVSIVTDAKTALKHLALRPCDLVLVDTRLPVVDGLQLLMRIKDRHPYMARVVLATRPTEAELQKAAQYGASEFIEKPATPADYEAAVERVGQILSKTPDIYRGSLDAADISEFIGKDVEGGRDVTVMIYMGFDRGTLLFTAGRLVHAETQARKGKDAYKEILSWHDGIFEKRDGIPDPARSTIQIKWWEVFDDWRKEMKKKPSVNTTVVNREFRSFVTGEAPAQPAPPEEKSKKVASARVSRVAPKVAVTAKLAEETGVSMGLQLDSNGNIESEFHCPDPTLMRGVVSFTLAKAREIAAAYQWDMPLSVHYVSTSMNLAVLPYKQKSVMLGWASKNTGVLEKINRTFGEDSLDAPEPAGKSTEPATVEAVKKLPGLHGYAIFKKPVQLLVKKFSADWSFEMLELTARIASQMCTILRLQGMPLELIQIKFKVGSVLARPAGDLTLIVISHSQTKTPLLKDCMLRISGSEIKKSAL